MTDSMVQPGSADLSANLASCEPADAEANPNLRPTGALYTVRLEIRVPIAATDEQITEWLRYNLGADGSIGTDNPLIDEPCDAFGPRGFDADYTGYTGRREEFDRVETETGHSYKVRHIRERAK